jgi:hypothetical protein
MAEGMEGDPMNLKPITKRERKLMKQAFEAARLITIIKAGLVGNCLPIVNKTHGNFNDFLFKNKYKVK